MTSSGPVEPSARGRLDFLESASGLRPVSAFLLVAAVLGVVLLRGAKIALADEGSQPANEKLDHTEQPDFEIVDRRDAPLALSVERLKLVLSPNAMWQAHTPDWMARRISEALGGKPSPEELLRRMLPDAEKGVITVDREPLLLDAREAQAVHRWIATGRTEAGEEDARPPCRVQGAWVQPTERPGEYVLAWAPEILLSEAVREEQGFDRPQSWTQWIADALLACLIQDPAHTFSPAELEDERREVWDALIPSHYKVVLSEIPPEAALDLHHLLAGERVHAHQMEICRGLARRYPLRDGALAADPDLAREDEAPFPVLGRFGTFDAATARALARAELGLSDDGACSGPELASLEELATLKMYRPSAQSGLERLCARTLALPAWSFLERGEEGYAYRANQVARGPLHRYFKEMVPGAETPRVRTTLDASLQREVRSVLEGVMAEHDPALCMAIAVELETGDVLAVDALDAYGASGFAPILHTFTPGSTFKVVTMATALDAGVVSPEERFDTHDGDFVTGGHRIREAEGAPVGVISAREGLAYSCNAVLAQIGMRVDDDVFHARVVELGYGRAPATGLGPERPGMVPPLPWKLNWTHASISFGHEVSVTLWQHAAALAAVVRGGEWLPLNLLDAVVQNGREHALARAPRRRVFSQRACDEVRSMMVLGAREGTGRRVALPDLEMGTKTGTAQKVETEVCLHVELAHNASPHACSKACRRALRGQRAHARSCYTSSMCTFGRLPGDDREVLVLVVVEEPRGKSKFGADVAGEAAVAILAEALGHTRGRELPIEVGADGFAPSAAAFTAAAEQPWAEAAVE